MKNNYHGQILVVDDEPEILAALKRQLHREFDVFTADSAQTGLAILAERPIDVVISDQRMPGVTGVEFLGEVRERYPDTARVLLSGYSDIQAVISAVNRGQIFGYIPKPWEVPEIRTMLRQCVEIGHLRSKNRDLITQLEQVNRELVRKVDEKSERLRNSEEKYRLLAENAPAMLYRMSLPDGRYEYVSPIAKEIFGYPPQVWYEKPILIRELIHPDWQGYFAEQWAQLLTGNIPATYEYQIIHQSGQTRWLSQRNTLIQDANGHPQAIQGIVTDITAQKQADEYRHVNERRLDLLLALNREAHTLSEYQICERALDIAVEITGSRVGYLHRINPDQESINLISWNQEARKQCTVAYQNHYPLSSAGIWADSARERRPVVHNDYPHLPGCKGLPEGHFPLRRHMSVPVVEEDKVGMIIGVGNKEAPYDDNDVRQLELIADEVQKFITRKHAETALINARQQAESANQAKSVFLANMSHELRTPLNAVLGFAQLMEMDDTLTDHHRLNMTNIRSNGELLLELINDVLDLAKIEAGRFECFPEPWQTTDFFEELVRIFRLRAEQKKLAFRYEPHGSLPNALYCDPRRLRQIAMNLLGNAVKFTRHGSVTLRTAFRDGRLHLEVVDTGPGIATDMREKIFEPFQQAGDNHEKIQGTGLGLAITRKLTELMDGTLSLTSTVDKGCTFRVEIPAQVVEGRSRRSSLHTGGVKGYRRLEGSRPFRILVADDVAGNRAVLRGILETLGFEVILAETGKQCIELAWNEEPDAVLLDLYMPEMDGFEAVRVLRKLSEFRNLPVIAVTADAFAETRHQSLAAGCNAHLTKPVKLEALLEALGEALPLQWDYKNAPEIQPVSAEEKQKIPREQIDKILSLLKKGNISGVITVAKQLEQSRCCPVLARKINKLALNFKISELKRLIGSL